MLRLVRGQLVRGESVQRGDCLQCRADASGGRGPLDHRGLNVEPKQSDHNIGDDSGRVPVNRNACHFIPLLPTNSNFYLFLYQTNLNRENHPLAKRTFTYFHLTWIVHLPLFFIGLLCLYLEREKGHLPLFMFYIFFTIFRRMTWCYFEMI